MTNLNSILSELAGEYQAIKKGNMTLSSNSGVVYMSGNNSSVDSGERSMSHIHISVSRFGYGKTSTISQYKAFAYDECGQLVDVLEGYFIEPCFDPDKCTTANSDTAIPGGTYKVVPSLYHGKSGYFEVTGVSGRTAIKIHSGYNGGWTEGCLLPGSSYNYNQSTNEYSFNESDAKDSMIRFRNFMNSHASGYATMTINP